MRLSIPCSLVIAIFAYGHLDLSAAPSLPITKPPAVTTPSYTGPLTEDTHAIMGQWFKSVSDSNLTYRTHEFYDNTPANGGGTSGHLAISGRVTHVVFDDLAFFDPKPIVAFDIEVRVHNDTPSLSGSWAPGTNMLNELRAAGTPYSNTLYASILTVNFAIADNLDVNMDAAPYRSASPYIKAINHDTLAWYGWNSAIIQDGTFLVPGWYLGDIAPGQAATVTMNFVITLFNGVNYALDPLDSRYTAIMDSYNKGTDILISRTSGLKINSWVSDPVPDEASAYPVSGDTPLNNVAVFHNTAEDLEQSVSFGKLTLSPSGTTRHLESMGSAGISTQILQSCTSLVASNWINVATNRSWPLPQINHWTIASPKSPSTFFRIISP